MIKNEATTRRTGYEKAKKRHNDKKEAKEKLVEMEDEELQEGMQSKKKEVLSGEIDWLQYLSPKDLTNLEECRRLDKYNDSVFEHNNVMLPKVNELLPKLGQPKYTLHPPPKYLPVAQQKYEKMLFNHEFRILRSVEWLYEKGKIAVKDYRLIEGPKLADMIAEKEYIQEQIEQVSSGKITGIDITDAVGRSHIGNCTCNNLWDGESERCMGEGLRIRWKRVNGHHFLRPRIEPETY
jgi:hypothetical protein